MNEEIIMAEETSDAAAIEAEEVISEAEELKNMLSRMSAENAALRRRVFCSERGVPSELAEDIIILAEAYADKKGISFEDAAAEVYGRICTSRSAAHTAPVTTGIRSENVRAAGNDRLRRAFGLR